MTNRDLLMYNGYEDTIIFENPSFEGALIGVSSDDRAIYSYDKMVESAMQQEGWTEEEAKIKISERQKVKTGLIIIQFEVSLT